MHLPKRLVVGALLLAAPIAAWALVKPLRVLAPQLEGLACDEWVCIDDASRRAEAKRLYRDALNAEIEAVTKTATTAEWIATLNKAGVPCGPIYTIDNVFEDAQVKHLNLVEKVPGTGERDVTLVKQPFSLSRTPSRFVAPPPEVGEHTDELLHEFGFSDAEIATLKQKKAI